MTSIEDHAVIGDCRSTALVARDGTIDWLCWPRFDSPAVFASILDETGRGGRWQIAPRAPFCSSRRYVGDSNVLETRFTTDDGAVLVLTDAMTVEPDDDRQRGLVPEHEIVRVLRCERGSAEIVDLFEPRPMFGTTTARVRDHGALGTFVEDRHGTFVLRSDARGGRIHAGEAFHWSLGFAADGPAVLSPLGKASEDAVARTIDWWTQWAARLRYEGPARDAVVRSALALRLLVHAPSGAIVAAPTTSLPERLGGDLNWDYRFCWLRDASFAVRALVELGADDEAAAFVSWLLHTTALTRPELHVLYDVYGNAPRHERVLEALTGFARSRPIRVGNAAAGQLQLDVYGEVVESVALLARNGASLDRETQRAVSSFGDWVCRHWNQADEGIWEPRSGRRHHTHSRLLSWVAVDRVVELARRGALAKVDPAPYAQARDAIRSEIEARAWDPRRASYSATIGGDDVDATLLLFARHGFAPAGSPRLRGTRARVRRELDAGHGLLYRYRRPEDSRGEGAFAICSFWDVEHLALGGGTLEEARALFEQLLGFGNDVGLFAEEIDPTTGAALGNFPQAFTHVGLINAALSIATREAQERREERCA